ncbi:DNA primase large subunit Spp2 [Paecilomyces lecythidis]|uniref:DNA primase large subunit Spp2 n=1 Tax=Paecilomyces lecythidis TaxID=3004212 RepID=A0ABR3WXD6_9EURO
MSSNSQQHQQPHHRGWLSEEIFSHKHQNEGANAARPEESHVRYKESPKKESEIDKIEDDIKKDERKFKDYIHKDKQLEEEGDTYGGLM